MAQHFPRSKRYFTNHLQDFDDKLTKEAIQSRYQSDILQEVENVVGLIVSRVKADPRAEDGGLYVGLSGVAYGLFYASQSSHLSVEIKELCLTTAGKYLEASLEYCRKKSETRNSTGAAFLLGHLGVYVLAAVFYAKTGETEKSKQYIDKFISLHSMCKPVDFLSCGGDELLVGRAGYLCGALYLQQELGESVIPANIIQTIVKSTIQSGRVLAAKLKSPSPLMYSYYDSLYLGAAHGLSAILQMLLVYSKFLDSEATKDVTAACYCMLSCETENNNYPACLNETRDHLWHWCHGSPGVIYFLIKASQVFKDKKFGDAALRAGGDNLWKHGLLLKGPGICHGVAGSGYAFLALYRATGQLKHLYRAHQFGQFMFAEEFIASARTPDCPYSLYEGWAGSLCFLVDLLEPENSSFPFFNVFK